MMRFWVHVLIALAIPGVAFAQSPWVVQPSGTTERLRSVAAVDDRVVWATGNHGTCLRSVDGGGSWQRVPAEDSAGLDFRDVEAFDAERAFALAIGPGEASRIMKATHGGTTLVESYHNRDPKKFFDAIAFWDHEHGLALSDPVDGRFVILRTNDAGRVWEQTSDPGTMPAALPNEGAFAASGTCLVVRPDGQAWFGTGGAGQARVFHSTDGGRSWTATSTSIRADQPSRGIFGLGFRDNQLGIAVGGDYKKLAGLIVNGAATADGGRTWSDPGLSHPLVRPLGFRSAVAYLPKQPETAILAVGPGQTESSIDGGATWRLLAGGAEGWHALAVAPSGRFAWAVGEEGKIGRLTVADALKAR